MSQIIGYGERHETELFNRVRSEANGSDSNTELGFKMRNGNYITRWMPGNKHTKFGNKKTVTGGRKYDSKMEANYSQQLELRRLAGEIQEYIPQFQIGIYIGGSLWNTWRVDFKVVLKDGEMQLHEVKGFETREYILKRDAFLLVKASDYEGNYVTDYKNGNKIDKTVQLIVIK